MIDLETVGTSLDCVIMSIGIVKFNPKTSGIISKLLLKPTIEDQTEVYNRVIDEGTLAWWAKQSPDAVEATFNDNDRMSFTDCMEVLYHYCWNQERVWANGTCFDIVILEHALKQCLTDLPNSAPWQFWNVRDTRSFYEAANVRLKDKKYGTKTTHNAMEDAEHQVIVLQDAYRKLIKAGVLSED
jgi:exodeoxyribonuclease VIII